MNLYTVGLNHKTADVRLREQVSFSPSRVPDALKALCAQEGIVGAVVLSTCNRTELYIHADDAQTAWEKSLALLESGREGETSPLDIRLYRHKGLEAAQHLFEVVASLDSMVLGEAQIIGQVRDAFKASHAAGCCTSLLSRVFRQALEVGKRVRAQTGIGDAHVSLSTVAVDVAKEKFGDLSDRTVLILGSGKMSELAARYLQEQGAQMLLLASRTFAHASSVANEVGAAAHRMEDLLDLIGQADIIISSTSAPHCILFPKSLEKVSKPLLILDLAMPRDVDPACAELPGVSLCDLDDLGTIAALNQRRRQDCTQEVRAIVEDEVAALEQWEAQHAVLPTIKQLYASAEDLRCTEVEHLLRSLSAELSDADLAAINAATSAIVKKMLHAPTSALRASVVTHTDYECVESARLLFNLQDAQEG